MVGSMIMGRGGMRRVRGSERQAYSFGYDGLQRITSGTYADINDAGTFTATISNSQRNGLFLSGACHTQALLDNMAYSYTTGTNKISSITDAASATQGGFPAASGSYTYDTNGNQISDGAKGFTAITYNHLNLPTKFTQGANTIEIQYDAAGRKLKKIPSGGATKSYIGTFEYSNSTVEAIYHSEGRARNNAGAFIYEYLIKDHLGNTRVAFTNTTGTIALVQENHYYAFGMPQAGWLAEPSPTNAYKYNGKELNTEFGLNLMDYGARWYDAGVGRWTSVDPMAEKYASWTLYNYVYNNPINGIDPNGKDGILIVFPNFKVETETKLGKQPLGHAGVLLIDNATGKTKYYEYGRYSTPDGTKGRVRSVSVPNVKIGEDGKPTQASLTKVFSKISEKAGQGGKIEGSYVEGDFKKMNDYAQDKLKESNSEYKEYDKERKPYSLFSNNCGTFGCDVLKQDPDVKRKAPFILSPTPNNVSEEYQDNFPSINYDPKANSISGSLYKKKN